MMIDVRLVLDVDVPTWSLEEGPATTLGEVEAAVRGRVGRAIVQAAAGGVLPGVVLVMISGGGVDYD